MSSDKRFFITADELQARLGAPELRIVDASWYLPAHGRDGRAEFEAARIPGAVFFDIDAISDKTSSLPHMLASPAQFAAAVGALGISESDDIVIYDCLGLLSAPRAWWNFRIMGARSVRILSGGFDRWRAAGRPVETGAPGTPVPAVFNAAFQPEKVASFADMKANIGSSRVLVLDARSFGRFAGNDPEPRPGLASGHIPGSKSLPWETLVADGRLKDIDTLRELFRAVSLEQGRPVVTTCGSGVSAAILTLALECLGHEQNALYDGSWAEWGSAKDAPVARWEESRS